MGSRNYEQEPEGLRLLERSVWSDRMVFVRAVHNSDWMSDLELSVYNSWCAATACTGTLAHLLGKGAAWLTLQLPVCCLCSANTEVVIAKA